MKKVIRRAVWLFSKPEKYGLDQRQLGLLKFGNESLYLMSQTLDKPAPGYEEIHYAKKSDHQLRIFYRSYTNHQGKTVQSFMFEYYINCAPHDFGKFCENLTEQKTLIPSVECFKVVEEFKVDTPVHNSVFYRAYPKMVVAKGRDFLYLKTCEYGKDYYRDVCRSISHPEMPEVRTHVRAEMLLVGNHAIRAPNSKSGRPRTKLVCIAETDVKAPVPGFVVKQVAKGEVKSMVERISKRVDTLYGHC